MVWGVGELKVSSQALFIFFLVAIGTIYSDHLPTRATVAKWGLASPVLLVAGAVDMAGSIAQGGATSCIFRFLYCAAGGGNDYASTSVRSGGWGG